MGRNTSATSLLRQRGDTIVEVLISVIVIATILSGAFVVAQASSHNVQSSQEHAYALQQVQAQIESIRTLASISGNGLETLPDNTTFCTYLKADKSLAVANSAAAPECANANTLYKVVDEKLTTANNTSGLTTFQVSVDWDKIGGGTNHESMTYGVKVQ